MLIMLNKLREKSSLIGIFWMIVTTIFFVGVTIFVKILGEKIPSSQTAFLRYLFGTIFLLGLDTYFGIWVMALTLNGWN